MSESRAVRLAAKLSGTPARLLHPDVVDAARFALRDAFEAGVKWAVREMGDDSVLAYDEGEALDEYLRGDDEPDKDNAGQSTKP